MTAPWEKYGDGRAVENPHAGAPRPIAGIKVSSAAGPDFVIRERPAQSIDGCSVLSWGEVEILAAAHRGQLGDDHVKVIDAIKRALGGTVVASQDRRS